MESGESNTIRILIADDHQIFRQGLRAALQSEQDIEVVAEANNGEEAVDLCERLKPDVAVLDISMPEMNGLIAARLIMSICKDTRVVILSTHPNEEYITRALKSGVQGYLLKSGTLEDLVAGIKTVHGGEIFLSPGVASFVVKEFIEGGESPDLDLDSVLTVREQQVLQMVAEGSSTAGIASRLSISPKTVGRHRENIMKKLDIHDVTGLVKFAIRVGLIQP